MGWFSRKQPTAPDRSAEVEAVDARRTALASLDDDHVNQAGREASTVTDLVAAAAVIAERVLGQRMFDSQIRAALAMAAGQLVEMPTGEGKTLAAVPAAAWLARDRAGVHVLTANDYLAGRDAEWMRAIYERLGLTVAAIQQSLTPDARRAAYAADVTYATANEVGFDHLRDGLARTPHEQVHRGLHAALIDEADSILIDEARFPLVIAGGASAGDDVPLRADLTVRVLRVGDHFSVDEAGRLVRLTPAGITRVERALRIENLFDPDNLTLHTAVQDALHAHALLHRDVDYLVQDDAIVSVDEIKGRVVHDRRWPAGLQTALEFKERVRRKTQGRVLGSVTVEHLVGLYTHVCGMTGTAATQAGEFKEIYDLVVEVIPPHRPVIRRDEDDVVFATRAEKESAVLAEIQRVHATGRPILVGTTSVAESERLSRALGSLPHHVLNARHETEEAAIVARAGERSAVTISTNMAGRGVDIRLGEGVAALGGLHVIGTNRHESRRVDLQLRGRAGRQGDPGSSQFFVSWEDPLALKYAGGDRAMPFDQMQRVAEGQNLDIRIFLRKYESIIEGQRQKMLARRQALVETSLAGPLFSSGVGPHPHASGHAQVARYARAFAELEIIDEFWSDYLAAIAELRAGTTWVSLGYGRPLTHYLREVHAMFIELEKQIDAEVAARLETNAAATEEPRQRGATWTYITTDEPFGPMTERIMRQVVKMARRKFFR